jgi:ubiquinone/menaquinone biosynthesis C-methylase UbiE
MGSGVLDEKVKDRVFPSKGDTIDFSQFTYSQTQHIALFAKHNHELELFGKAMDPHLWSMKRYQDLLVFSFIKQVIPEGARILEVGGGASRILAHFKDTYECWNVDKLEGIGRGARQINSSGFHLVRDYIGNFNPELRDNYFDLVFSISALEHVPDKSPIRLGEILRDLNRVLKPGGYSLHCFDSILKPKKMWTNKLLGHIFEKERTINQFMSYAELCAVTDLFVLPESIYNKNWFPHTATPYIEYGKLFSYNVLWKKNGLPAAHRMEEENRWPGILPVTGADGK